MSLAKRGYITVAVTVSMCDRAPIVALHARFGGAFQDAVVRTKTGRNVYRWTVFNADAVAALTVFSQRCLVKNVVAAAALPTAMNMRDNKTRGALSEAEKAARVAAAEVIARLNKPVGPRRILDDVLVGQYMQQKYIGGGKKVRLSDGREFRTAREAGTALGVSVSAISYAQRTRGRTCGLFVEYV